MRVTRVRNTLRPNPLSPLGTIFFGASLFLLLAVAWNENVAWRSPELREPLFSIEFYSTDEGYRMDAPPAITQEATARVILVENEPRGWLAPTQSVDRLDIVVNEWALTPPDVASIKEQSLQYVSSVGWRGLGEGDISPGGVFKRRALWLGWAFTVGIVITGAGLLMSLTWVPLAIRKTVAFAANRRTRRAIAAGRCSRCGYQMSGLPQCPECGRKVEDKH